MNETMVTVVGNLASEVTSKRVGSEAHMLVGFRVASSQRRWDRGSEAWVDGDRLSAWVSCWRRLGEGVVTTLVKGDPVIVTGRLSVREYEVNGERRFSTEIAATSVGPDLGRAKVTMNSRRPASVDGAADDRSADGASDVATATDADERRSLAIVGDRGATGPLDVVATAGTSDADDEIEELAATG